MSLLRLFAAQTRLEVRQLRAQIPFVVLTVIAALTFLATMSLFGLTGSELPLAVVDRDHGPLAERFVEAVRGVRHAFSVRMTDGPTADGALETGAIVGSLTIPPGFSAAVARGDTVALDVRVDNLNADMTSDLERGLPNAVVTFGQEQGFAGLRARLVEKDLVPRETGFLPYVAVSALGVDAMLIAGVLAALAMAREWEAGTVKVLRLAPSRPVAVVLGKVAIAANVTWVAMIATTILVVVGYGAVPKRPGGVMPALALCIFTFACMGACVGAWLKRTLPIVPLLFGLAMPLYIDCGALEPTRFDGERIWWLAHLSPLYYATGVLEWVFHGLRVTPEPIWLDALILALTCPISLWLAQRALAQHLGAP